MVFLSKKGFGILGSGGKAMTTMTKMKKTRTVKRGTTAAKATIQVRVDAKTKERAEKFFKRYGLSTGDGLRRLIDRAINDKDSWIAHEIFSHIPNAETARAIEEGMAEKTEPMTPEEFRKFLEEA
jgi:antitoxin component of RelBE/YafQ-DinJ toxin-antitoxin module